MKASWNSVAALLFAFCFCTSNQYARADDAAQVEVKLYGESLCPYCIRFTTQNVAPLFKQGLGSIFNFTYDADVAYGNAINTTEGPVCQHGAEECLFNRVINCAEELNPGQDKWFPFVGCLEGSLQGNFQKDEAATRKCAEDAGVSYDTIKKCANGKQGDELDAQAKAATDALQPAHTYVPWVVVNGVPLGADYGALKSVICAAYAGDRPEACFAVPPITLAAGSSRSKKMGQGRSKVVLSRRRKAALA